MTIDQDRGEAGLRVDRDREDVLWLRHPKERENPPTRHAVLWPAIEYTALVFVQATSRDTKLDPFERAVLGAAANGLTEIRKQASFLNLNEEFVGHIHGRLVDRGLLSHDGRYRNQVDAPLTPEAPVAIRLYQDHWSGILWPRFVTEHWRRRLPVDAENGPALVQAGTTGAPVEIRSLWVARPEPALGVPTSDDAREAVRTWTRLRSRIRVGGTSISGNGPIKLLPDSAQSVYLCCPNHRGRPGRPDVMDPFDGPTWAPFVRSLAEQSRAGTPLARWLYGESGEATDDRIADTQSLQERIGRLAETINTTPGTSTRWPQICHDMAAAGHEAVDALWATGGVMVEPLLLDPQSDLTLLEQACVTTGFDPTDLPAAAGLPEAVNGAGSLSQRCAALLLRFRADIEGPLHRLSERCPDLFTLLRGQADGRCDRESALELAAAVVALGEIAAVARLVPDNGRFDRGEG
ncbi:MAG: hypothetical protein KDB02_09450 [Acidimicrobiales bacterium]|nr:hypothetical protein [Acidimicrobiales bacterium]